MRIVSNSKHVKRMLAGRHEVYLVKGEEDMMGWHDPDEFGCIIIDIDQVGGVYAPRIIQKENSNLPIIGISAELPYDGDWFDQRATFIEQGGSYLLQAPINPREMLACIMELHRRFTNIRPLIRLADNRLVINASRRIVMFDNEPVPLTGKENLLFMNLADHFGNSRTKDQLLSALYSLSVDEEPEIKIIDVFVCKIRKKLNEMHPGLGRCIETVWGQGYRLNEIPEDVMPKLLT